MHHGVDDRLLNLLGVTALAATDRMRAATEAELPSGGSAPAALVHLHVHPGVSVEELRRVLGISQPATVRAVDRLAAENLLERRAGRDGRTLALHLTPKGEAAASALLRRRARSLDSLLRGLTEEEQAALTPLLEQIVAGLADAYEEMLHTCRLCDRPACNSGPGCPMGHSG
jgi:MarR family transcriptional regulator, negative regulator of the multidrug operon emrRAB